MLSAQEEALSVEWDQGELYHGHYGAIVQWKRPGEEYDESRQFDTGFGISPMMVMGRRFFAQTVDGLTGGVMYTVRVLATRRFAENAPPSAEMTITPFDPMNPP